MKYIEKIPTWVFGLGALGFLTCGGVIQPPDWKIAAVGMTIAVLGAWAYITHCIRKNRDGARYI